MSINIKWKQFIDDPVRFVQGFMLCRQAGVIFSSIVIARMLPLTQVGIIEMLMFCGYLMTFFWSDALLKGYLAAEKQVDDQKSASALVWFYLIIGAGFMAVLVLGQKAILPLLVDRSVLNGLEIYALYQALIISVGIAPFIGIVKGRNAILFSIYVLVGPSIACGIGLAFMPDLSGVLLGLLCYAFIGFAWVIANTYVVRFVQLKQLWNTIWPATWPLILYAISSGIARSFDAWLVARHFDESSFAIFRYGAREFPLVIALAAGLSMIMIPKLRQLEGLPELKTRSSNLMHYCFPIVAVVMFLSPVMFDFFFGPEYHESAWIFNLYLLLTLTQCMFPQSIMMARQDTKILWYISMAELGVNIISSLVLLFYFGLIGIVWGTLIAFTFEKIVLLLLVYKRYGIRVGQIVNTQLWWRYAILLVAVFILSKWVFGIL